MNAYTCGRVPSRALSHKSTYTLNVFSEFHYLALMYKSDPPQCFYYISIFANIWYMIKLINSITIILRVFMFYKQRVLANCWGRKDSAICASRKSSGHYFTIWHLWTSRTHLNVAIISLFFANIWYLIKLIHSITIILRVFMFYKQRVLANCWGRKDSAICASRKRSGHYFTIWHFCTSRTHLNVAIISLFFANIWYLIKLIHWITIILRVFMFYKQRVLANCWGRKDSAICASRKRSGACYCTVHMEWALYSLFMPTALSFWPQKSAKTRSI